jgi:anionic cell wall polymer biosynthesis LytR-Cps2A-Psr (LCP) family protein
VIFVSIDPKNKKTTLISIPRDVWIADLNAKINAAYTYGEEKQKGGGLKTSKTTVSKFLNQPIDYGFKIDFDGFVKSVDMMGGLDLTVDRTFDDYAYPITGKEIDPCGLAETEIASLSAQLASGSATELDSFPCRYEHLHFDKGETHMNGITALKYVRSRHAMGPEGSDFARSKRQTKVITAFKEKIFSVGTFLNPVKVISLMEILKSSIDTDIKQEEYADFVKLFKKMQHAKIESIALDTGDESEKRFGLLDNPPPSSQYGNQWILAPRTGGSDFSEIQEYVACRLKGINCTVGRNSILTPTPTPMLKPSVTPQNRSN